jgi:hypothetical protein
MLSSRVSRDQAARSSGQTSSPVPSVKSSRQPVTSFTPVASAPINPRTTPPTLL